MAKTTVTFRNSYCTYTRTGQTVHTIVRTEFGRKATYVDATANNFNYKGDSGKSVGDDVIGQVRGPLRPKYSFGRSLMADVIKIETS
jgi:hypothetical protein